MADRKITDLTALAAGSQATGDLLTIVDVSEAAATDKNKKITVESLFKGIPGNVGIGTSSPAAPLEVVGTTNGDQLRINQSGQHYRIGREGSGGLLEFYGAQSGYNGFIFGGANGERLRIDSSGRVLIGTSNNTAPGGFNAKLQIADTSFTGSISLRRDSDNASAQSLVFGKSRGTLNSATVVQSGDKLGAIAFYGADGSDLNSEAAQICAQVDGTPGSNDMPGRLVFSTTEDGSSSSTERMRIDSSGRLLIGSTSAVTNVLTFAPAVQVEGTTANTSRIAAIRNAAATGAFPSFICAKSRGTSNGSYTIVQSGDKIGAVEFAGADGAKFVGACSILAEVDGTPGLNDMPGRMIFSTTADNASSPTERLRINSSGNVGIGTSSPGSKLHISDNTAPPLEITRDQAIGGSGILLRQPNTTDGNDLRITYESDTTGTGAASNVQFAAIEFTAATHNNSTRAGEIGFYTAKGGEGFIQRMRIDSSGRLLVGTSTARSNFFAAVASAVQVEGNDTPTSTISVVRNSNNADGPTVLLGRSRGTGNTIVQNGDRIGRIEFQANDGSNFLSSANIQAFVDGTPGTSDMPTRLTFSTCADGASSPTERMRLNSSGAFMVGQTNGSSGTVGIVCNANGLLTNCTSNVDASIININNLTGAKNLILFRSDGTNRGSIETNGSTVTYNTTSDYRVKENVVDIDGAIDRVKQLLPKRFNFISHPERTVDGFLAHEAQTVVPEAVTGTHNEVDDDGNAVMQGIDQSKLVPLLTAALQEAIAEIETLKTKVAALEAG